MRRLRRSHPEPRIELIPLIDVMTFLLTFFVYAFVLIARVEVLPMELQRFEAGRDAEPLPAVTISIDLDGRLYVDRVPTEMDRILDDIRAAAARDPDTVIYLALADGEGPVDRAPILTALWDRLQNAGLAINFVGRPESAP
jgi:biopolymer transport protein ExbD